VSLTVLTMAYLLEDYEPEDFNYYDNEVNHSTTPPPVVVAQGEKVVHKELVSGDEPAPLSVVVNDQGDADGSPVNEVTQVSVTPLKTESGDRLVESHLDDGEWFDWGEPLSNNEVSGEVESPPEVTGGDDYKNIPLKGEGEKYGEKNEVDSESVVSHTMVNGSGDGPAVVVRVTYIDPPKIKVWSGDAEVPVIEASIIIQDDPEDEGDSGDAFASLTHQEIDPMGPRPVIRQFLEMSGVSVSVDSPVEPAEPEPRMAPYLVPDSVSAEPNVSTWRLAPELGVAGTNGEAGGWSVAGPLFLALFLMFLGRRVEFLKENFKWHKAYFCA